MDDPLTPPRTPQQRALQALVRRRVQVLALLSSEENRLSRTSNAFAHKMIEGTISRLKTPQKTLDDQIASLLAELEQAAAKVKILNDMVRNNEAWRVANLSLSK